MDNVEIKALKDFYWSSLFEFYRMGLQTSGKKLDDVLFGPEGQLFWRKKNGAVRTFGRKLKQVLKGRG